MSEDDRIEPSPIPSSDAGVPTALEPQTTPTLQGQVSQTPASLVIDGGMPAKGVVVSDGMVLGGMPVQQPLPEKTPFNGKQFTLGIIIILFAVPLLSTIVVVGADVATNTEDSWREYTIELGTADGNQTVFVTHFEHNQNYEWCNAEIMVYQSAEMHYADSIDCDRSNEIHIYNDTHPNGKIIGNYDFETKNFTLNFDDPPPAGDYFEARIYEENDNYNAAVDMAESAPCLILLLALAGGGWAFANGYKWVAYGMGTVMVVMPLLLIVACFVMLAAYGI